MEMAHLIQMKLITPNMYAMVLMGKLDRMVLMVPTEVHLQTPC
jgi:hypothetical protein